MNKILNEKIQANPKYHFLAARRMAYARRQVFLMLLIWFGYIMLCMFSRDFAMLPPDAEMAINVLVGVIFILCALLLTRAYALRARQEFDARMAEIVRELRQATD
jgi:uncharacterized membrane protein (DUF485 family)